VAEVTVGEAKRRLKACGWRLIGAWWIQNQMVVAQRKSDGIMLGVRCHLRSEGYNKGLWSALADLMERIEAMEVKP